MRTLNIAVSVDGIGCNDLRQKGRVGAWCFGKISQLLLGKMDQVGVGVWQK